jgi:hypothetical protein
MDVPSTAQSRIALSLRTKTLLNILKEIEINKNNSYIFLAENIASTILRLTVREDYSHSEFEEIEKNLDFYCLAIFSENYQWAREALGVLEKISSSTFD